MQWSECNAFQAVFLLHRHTISPQMGIFPVRTYWVGNELQLQDWHAWTWTATCGPGFQERQILCPVYALRKFMKYTPCHSARWEMQQKDFYEILRSKLYEEKNQTLCFINLHQLFVLFRNMQPMKGKRYVSCNSGRDAPVYMDGTGEFGLEGSLVGNPTCGCRIVSLCLTTSYSSTCMMNEILWIWIHLLFAVASRLW